MQQYKNQWWWKWGRHIIIIIPNDEVVMHELLIKG